MRGRERGERRKIGKKRGRQERKGRTDKIRCIRKTTKRNRIGRDG